MGGEDFWGNKERAGRKVMELKRLKEELKGWVWLRDRQRENEEWISLSEGEEELEGDWILELEEGVRGVECGLKELEVRMMLGGENDGCDAIMSIHAGAGGVESCDWVSMLERMYMRWANLKGFCVEIMDYLEGEEAGVKSITFLVRGEYSYGLLRGEVGVHRLVRISPFDANKKRHTSFASVSVLPDLEEEVEVEILDKDIKVDTYRAQGAGGQHVNTTDSAVRIRHLETGIVVQCQNDRSQHKNKANALKVLKARLYEYYERERRKGMEEIQGEKKGIGWGNQIRSYVFQPYVMVKDHRTGIEEGNGHGVIEGELLNQYIDGYLKWRLKRR